MGSMNTARIACVAGLCLGLAGVAHHAAAQARGGQGRDTTFERRLGDEAQTRSNVTLMISESDGGDTYTLRMSGDDVSAEINGEKLPQDRIRRRGGTVELLDKSGEVVHTFNVRGLGGMRGLGSTEPRRLLVTPGLPGQGGLGAATLAVPGGTPRVMLGINMSDAGDSEGVTVDNVIPDLPAAQAGVKVGDVIVRIGEQEIKQSSDVRDALSKAEAGDRIDLVVRRDGAEKTLKVKVEKFDAGRLGIAEMTGAPQAWTMDMGDHAWRDEARRALEKAMEEIKASSAPNVERLKKEAAQALEQALKSMKEAQAQGQNWWMLNRERLMGDGSGEWLRAVPPPPAAPAAPGSAQLERQLERLTAQLEALQKRLDEMERRRPRD